MTEMSGMIQRTKYWVHRRTFSYTHIFDITPPIVERMMKHARCMNTRHRDCVRRECTSLSISANSIDHQLVNPRALIIIRSISSGYQNGNGILRGKHSLSGTYVLTLPSRRVSTCKSYSVHDGEPPQCYTEGSSSNNRLLSFLVHQSSISWLFLVATHYVSFSHASRSNTNCSAASSTQRITTPRGTSFRSSQSVFRKSPGQCLLRTNLLAPNETIDCHCNSTVDIHR